jgi:LPXTG-motif cell wall-anchored protein
VGVLALAVGWATPALPPAAPDSIASGDTWNTTITVLQHGRTPLEGVTPTLTIQNGGEKRTFTAKATDEPGKYAVAVTFPSGGPWTISVYDGFTQYGNPQTTTFGTVEVTGGPAATGGDFPLGWTLAGLGAALAAGLALLFLRRSRTGAQPLPSS